MSPPLEEKYGNQSRKFRPDRRLRHCCQRTTSEWAKLARGKFLWEGPRCNHSAPQHSPQRKGDPKPGAKEKADSSLERPSFSSYSCADLTDSKADSNVWGINLRGRAHYAFDS